MTDEARQSVSGEEPREVEVAPEGSSEENVSLLSRLHQHSEFSGPLPPPALLQGYENVLPGLGKTIVEMAQKAQDHAIECEKEELRIRVLELEYDEKAAQDDAAFRKRAQYLSAVLMLAVLICVTALGYFGLGGTAGTVAAVFGGVIAAGLLGKRWRFSVKQIDEDEEQSERK